MLPRAFRMVRQAEKELVKPDKAIVHVVGILIHQEGIFERAVFTVKPPKEFDEVQRVGKVKGPVFEPFKNAKITCGMILNERIGIVIHHSHEFQALIDDRDALSPGERGGKQPGNLNILQPAEAMRDRYRVRYDKLRLVELADFLVEERLEFEESGQCLSIHRSIFFPANIHLPVRSALSLYFRIFQ